MNRLPTNILLLLAILLGCPPLHAAAASGVSVGEARQCRTLAATACRPVPLEALPLSGPESILVRRVTVDPRAMPMSRPLMVWVVATASSEIRWNGVVIGRNGQPGPNRIAERPGRFFATFIVPPQLVKPGANLVSARMSAHHLWMPVRRPVHEFYVAPYESPGFHGLRAYLPALLVLGALAAAAIYFGAAAAVDRKDRVALLLAIVASLAVLQLLAETARAFIAYTYPWHVARVMAVAVLAAATWVLVSAWAAQRFAPEWRRTVVTATAATALASVAIVPWFDLKALAAILAGLLAVAICARRGVRHHIAGARPALAWAAATLGLMVYQRTQFLDQAYYLSLAAMLTGLVAEQVGALRQARKSRDAEALRAVGLEERLKNSEPADTIIQFKDGTRTHRVAEATILFVKAADDYCEVRLRDGRTLLATTTLARLHGSLPERFVRVHKSYVVNGDHVAAVAPRPAGGRMLVLTDGSSVPVGRSYGPALTRWTSPEAVGGDRPASA